ncbi:glutamate ABC transporter substrate-binding protein [Corynebacterium sp. L4756]|uniref:glutamate ABC transporter substrate-binding protein n=1 Tax=unclassified Corynebacterium TaxID=2624378 RepID=UPI00374C923D
MSHSKIWLTTLLTATLFLTACGSNTPDDTNPAPDPAIEQEEESPELPRAFNSEPMTAPIAGPPLPVGSRWMHASEYTPAETDFDGELEGTYRPDDATPEERVPNIIERGRLIVGVDQSHNLLSYRDAASGDIQGFEVDLAHEIAEDIFGDRNRVDFRFLESAERSEALQNGTVDIVIRTMTMTPEREETVAFSRPYMTTDTRMLVLTSSGITSFDETSGRTICSVEGSTALDKVAQAAPHANLLIARSWGDCLMALQLGQANAIVVDDTLLSGMVAQDPYSSIVGEVLDTEVYGVGIRRPDAQFDSRGLIRQVNSTIERTLEDGTWQSLFDEWFGQYLPTPTLPEPKYIEEKPEEDSEEES